MFTREVNGLEIVAIVEDNVITTAKVYKDGEFLTCEDIMTGEGEDVPYTEGNLNAVFKYMANLNLATR